MKKTPDDMLEIAMLPASRCRVAYTLNNTQPVRCTIIGDQPLFYMDFEGEIDADAEAAFDDSFAFEKIEKGLHELRRKISALDKLAPSAKSASASLEEVYEDFAHVTKPAELPEFDGTAKIEAILRKSRLASAYFDFGTNYKLSLLHSRQIDGAFYDRESGTILINPDLDETDQIILASRELRRLWQHRNGARLHPLTFHPDQAILVNRAQAADLSVSMVRIAWELQLAGEKGPWERIEASSMGDLARAFARESYLDFRTLNNGTAAAAVFETWFLSDRCRTEDRRLIQYMLSDYRGYVFEGEQPSQAVTAELIATLGSMPFGKNYLAPYVQTITSDAVFTEVRDRSNANFLWFIKFERSFRETEQELQKSKTQKSGVLEGKKDNENTAEIISLTDTAPLTGAKAAQGGAKIIVFRSGPDRK